MHDSSNKNFEFPPNKLLEIAILIREEERNLKVDDIVSIFGPGEVVDGEIFEFDKSAGEIALSWEDEKGSLYVVFDREGKSIGAYYASFYNS
ncbi:MAG: hypothetical protein AAGI68_07850 [Planctomycetota bacterium]